MTLMGNLIVRVCSFDQHHYTHNDFLLMTHFILFLFCGYDDVVKKNS